jgi:hypothetical protein
MLPLESIFQPKSITVKTSTLTSNKSNGLLSRIGSMISSLWNKATNKVENELEVIPSKESPIQVNECSLDNHMNVVLPILDPYKFQEEFHYRLTSTDANERSTYKETYIEDEGFYYIEDPLCTPTAKKSLHGNKKLKGSLSEASWAETYGSESDTGTSPCKEPLFSTNPPILFAAPAIDTLSKEDLSVKESMVDQVLEMVDDNKLQEPVMTLPFTTQVDVNLLSIFNTTQLNPSAADFSIPTTMEMTVMRTEEVGMCVQEDPIKTTSSWSQVVYSKNKQ